MIKKNISISISNILKAYKLNGFYLNNVLNYLYKESTELPKNISINEFDINDIICINKYNNLKLLNEYKEKTGVYIFLDKVNTPVYIGVSGEQSQQKQDLRKRLEQQFNGNGVLVKNIVEIENLLNSRNIQEPSDGEKKKIIIKNFIKKLIVINTGNLSSPESIEKSLNLEKCLIAIFNSKYNR